MSERMEQLCVVYICRKWSYAIGGNMVTRKKTLAEWKAFFDTVVVKRADLKDKVQFLLFLKKKIDW